MCVTNLMAIDPTAVKNFCSKEAKQELYFYSTFQTEVIVLYTSKDLIVNVKITYLRSACLHFLY